jgi:hypothetical protein
MMNTIEATSTVMLAIAVFLGALIILPSPKPEPQPSEKQPASESVVESVDIRPDTQRAEPLTDAQRIDNLGAKLDTIKDDVIELKELVKLQQAVKRSPAKDEGKQK